MQMNQYVLLNTANFILLSIFHFIICLSILDFIIYHQASIYIFNLQSHITLNLSTAFYYFIIKELIICYLKLE